MSDLPPTDFSLSAYQYHLPPERIAQNPVTPRDASRLLVVDSPTSHQHRHFRDLPDLLAPNDLLVLNNTRVIPARLLGHKAGGGASVEVFLLEEQSANEWLALVRPGRRLKPGATILFGADINHPDLVGQVVATDPATNGRVIQFHHAGPESLYAVFERLGQVPLPPYITKTTADADQYQTVYAEQPGAVAAPTAGLHFTPELFERLQAKGIQHTELTLHVGIGTFRPIETDNILEHKMHGEWVDIPSTTVDQILATKAQGGRVMAVGTTVTRALEGAAQGGQLQPYQGKTDLYIYPGYQFRVLDGLITNFHLPGSSLLLLVSALIGRERLLNLYADAIRQDYRFYSFGDAMVILPSGCREQP
jgi:S-adenosylmethionine:tRNA ribosyltransferase-isomerase